MWGSPTQVTGHRPPICLHDTGMSAPAKLETSMWPPLVSLKGLFNGSGYQLVAPVVGVHPVFCHRLGVIL